MFKLLDIETHRTLPTLFQMRKRIPYSFIHSFTHVIIQELLTTHHVPDSGPGLFLGTPGIMRWKTQPVTSVSSEFSGRDADSYGTEKGGRDEDKAEKHPTHSGREDEGPWRTSHGRSCQT